MKKVAISIHAERNFNPNVIERLRGFDYIHIDVMDGKFVETVNLNLSIFNRLKERYNIPIIAHLMVVDPSRYIEKVIEDTEYFLFHVEIDEEIVELINHVKNLNKKVGLVINPVTQVSKLLKYLPKLDIVLLLGVNPGKSGQTFIPYTIQKLKELAKYKKKYTFLIDVDGGINLETAEKLKNADILTSASTILNAKNPNIIIKKLKEL